jgi:aminotransferase
MSIIEKINPIVKEIPPSGIRRFFELANEIKDCISLGIGEPDFVTPLYIRESAIKSIEAGKTQYTSNAGLLELREMIAKYLDKRFSLSYEPKDEIIITIGASEAIDLSLRTFVTPGDEVIVPDPSYVSYAPNVRLVGGVPVPVKTRMENDFALTPEDLESAITPKSKVLILPYPNNPTGAIMTAEQLAAIVPVIVKHDLIVVSDEIYSELTYGGTHVSIASFEGMKDRTVYINGFSKAFAMTGWRVGYVCAPKDVIKQMYKIHQYTIMCAPTASQYAAYEALKGGFEENFSAVNKMREAYDERRKLLVREFNSMGLSCFTPRGAFYVFPCVANFYPTGDEFAEKLLYAEKVAVVPGAAFGQGGAQHVRCSYAYSLESLKKACVKIRAFTEKKSENK